MLDDLLLSFKERLFFVKVSFLTPLFLFSKALRADVKVQFNSARVLSFEAKSVDYICHVFLVKEGSPDYFF